MWAVHFATRKCALHSALGGCCSLFSVSCIILYGSFHLSSQCINNRKPTKACENLKVKPKSNMTAQALNYFLVKKSQKRRRSVCQFFSERSSVLDILLPKKRHNNEKLLYTENYLIYWTNTR